MFYLARVEFYLKGDKKPCLVYDQFFCSKRKAREFISFKLKSCASSCLETYDVYRCIYPWLGVRGTDFKNPVLCEKVKQLRK